MSSVLLAEARGPLIVALDAGTSSVRALAFDVEGTAIRETEVQISYAIDMTPDGGSAYPANALFDLTVRCIDGVIDQLGARASDVAAVGVTSFWHSLLGVDLGGEPTIPVLYWADNRSAGEAAMLRQELDPHAVWQRTGCRLHSSYWPAKLRWLHTHHADAAGRTARWLSYAEFALGRLCDPPAGAVSISMASGTGLLDVHTMTWDAEVLSVSGITADRLSPLVDLGPPGCLRGAFARRWPALAGAHWFPALGDGACANVGSGAIGPARIALTVGTSAAVRLVLPRPGGAEWAVPTGLWAYRLDGENAVLGGALSNGGNLLGWIWTTTATGPGEPAMVAAAALPADSTGLTFLPFLAGERSPAWHDDATGVIAGLTLATRPADLIRAAMEAVAYRLAEVYEALTPVAAPDHLIAASGGAILSMPSWLTITADTLGHSLAALSPGDETTARGAALMAAVASGILPTLADAPDPVLRAAAYVPDMANHARYRAGRDRQARLEKALVQTGEFV
jgi:gluconokinase